MPIVIGMDTVRNPDGPPADVLQDALSVPEHIKGTRWEPIFHEILDRMQREASGLSLGTVQTLLMERIARFYVDMRAREEDGTINRLSIKEQKEFNSFWLAMTVEFNKQLLGSQERLRDALVLAMQEILVQRLAMVSDEKERKALRVALAGDFAQLAV
jgi:hypothetical protein